MIGDRIREAIRLELRRQCQVGGRLYFDDARDSWDKDERGHPRWMIDGRLDIVSLVAAIEASDTQEGSK